MEASQSVANTADEVVQATETPESCPFDLGTLPGGLTDSQRLDYLQNPFRPVDHSYTFPPRLEYGKHRKFQPEWLKTYDWLAYSPSANGGYCVPCTLFGRAHNTHGGQLVTKALTSFAGAMRALEKHHTTSGHKNCIKDASVFLSKCKGQSSTVEQQLISHGEAMIKRNRALLSSIVKTILLCGRQAIALRGHRTFDGNPLSEASSPGNPGNFCALLQFRIDSGDELLKENFTTSGSARPVTYRSPRIQNEIISLIGRYLQDSIVAEIKKATFFAVSADEASDTAKAEQMAVVLRYVSEDAAITESFLGFIQCPSTSGESLAGLIKDFISEDLGLDLGNLRGQAYDGASNMASSIRGVAGRIQQDYPKAVHIHCNSHVLNLCIMSACSIQPIRNLMGTLKSVNIFFDYSPKRLGELEKTVKEMAPESSRTRLVSLCKTRWSARHTALATFEELFVPLVETIDTIASNADRHWSADSTASAAQLAVSLRQFSFAFALVVTRHALDYCMPLTTSLQSPTMDLSRAYSHISTVTSAINDKRNQLDETHAGWYQLAEKLSESVNGTTPDASLPRRVPGGRQANRANVPGKCLL